jgi:hypothetical protein
MRNSTFSLTFPENKHSNERKQTSRRKRREEEKKNEKGPGARALE